jgi:hypothetical protein
MEADPPSQDKTTPTQLKDSPVDLPGSGASTRSRVPEAPSAQGHLSPTTVDAEVINGSSDASGALAPAPENERSHMRTPESGSPDELLSVYDDTAESDDEDAELRA